MKNIEVIKFECSEIALRNEIKRNPMSCVHCSNWQSAGEMARCLYHCKHCGERRARSYIKRIIEKYANKLNINYRAAWDLAYLHLTEKYEEHSKINKIYFDEDHFEHDLPKFYEKLLNRKK